MSSIVRFLANDKLGKKRERYYDLLPQQYYDAFINIENELNSCLIVVEDESKKQKSVINGVLKDS